jgi:hypothetical protein
MVTWAWGNSFCTAMAITWLIEWRRRSSWGLSLVLGSVMAGVVVVASLLLRAESAERVAVTAGRQATLILRRRNRSL